MAFSIALHLKFLRQSFSLNLKFINWVDCVSSRHKGNVYLCLPDTGIHNPSPQPTIYVGAGNSNTDAGVYLGTLY